jgi:hypothetical protein
VSDFFKVTVRVERVVDVEKTRHSVAQYSRFEMRSIEMTQAVPDRGSGFVPLAIDAVISVVEVPQSVLRMCLAPLYAVVEIRA